MRMDGTDFQALQNEGNKNSMIVVKLNQVSP